MDYNSATTSVKKCDFRYINVLRIIAFFSVIIIHVVVVTPLTYYSHDPDFELIFSQNIFRLSCIITTLFNSFAVPVFIMISGALFLNPQKEISYSVILKKYVLRIFLVLLIFGYVFSLMEMFWDKKGLAPLDFLLAVKCVFTNQSWDHLWYLYLIIALYLVTPILKAFTKSCTDKDFYILLIVFYVLELIIPTICNFLGWKFAFYFPMHYGVFYYLLGYAIHSDKLKIKNWLCFVFIFASIAYIVALAFIPDNLVRYGAGVKNIRYIALLSAGIFALAKNNITGSTTKCEKFLSSISFGVYIVHPIFINLLYKATPFTVKNYNIFLVWLIAFCFTSVCSIVLAAILKKIPYLKKLL